MMEIRSTTSNQLSRLFIGSTLLACVSFLGCATGDPDAPEEAAQNGAALNKDCGTSPAQYVYTGRIAPELVTNDYEDGCQGNSIVVDMTNYNSDYLSPQLLFGTAPDNQADCDAASLGYYVWEKTASGFQYLANHWRNGGDWSLGRCSIGLSSPVKLTNGKHYRLAVTARVNNRLKTLSMHSEKFQ